MSATQLEVFFAAPQKKEEYKSGNRPGLWGKYQRGRACPNVNDRSPDKPSLPNLVEKRFPGTKRWLTMPFWRLLTKVPMEAEELKSIFVSLPADERNVIVHSGHTPGNTFWRVQSEPQEIYEKLVEIGTVDAATAILALIKEAETNQNQRQHLLGLTAWARCSSKLVNDPILGFLVGEINGFIDRRFRRTEYFRPGNPSDLFYLQDSEIHAIWKKHGPDTRAPEPVRTPNRQKTYYEIGNEAGKRLRRAVRR